MTKRQRHPLTSGQVRAIALEAHRAGEQRRLATEFARLTARDDDATPEATVEAMNAALLARYRKESGGR